MSQGIDRLIFRRPLINRILLMNLCSCNSPAKLGLQIYNYNLNNKVVLLKNPVNSCSDIFFAIYSLKSMCLISLFESFFSKNQSTCQTFKKYPFWHNICNYVDVCITFVGTLRNTNKPIHHKRRSRNCTYSSSDREQHKTFVCSNIR